MIALPITLLESMEVRQTIKHLTYIFILFSDNVKSNILLTLFPLIFNLMNYPPSSVPLSCLILHIQ